MSVINFLEQMKVLDELVNDRTFRMRVWLYTVAYDGPVLLVGRMNMRENWTYSCAVT